MLLDGNPLRVWNLTQVQQKLGISAGSPLFQLAVAAGEVPGVSIVRVMGHNSDIDILSVPEDVWQGGGLYPFQTSAQNLEIVSSSAADAAAGTGLRTVRITGLDSNHAVITEDVTLNGVTPAALVNQYIRVNDCIGVTVGSGETNAGIVTLRVPGPGAIQAVIDTGDGKAHNSMYTVPAGFTLYLNTIFLSMLRQTGVEFAENLLMVRTTLGLVTVRNIFSTNSGGSSAFYTEAEYPLPFPEKTDLWFRVENVSANNTAMTVTAFGLLIDNEVL